jgi:hypothetical protein
MKRWLKAGLVVVLAIVVYGAVSYLWSKHYESKHAAIYQAKLAEFQSALTPGMTREQVEDALRARGVPFQRSCCQVGVFTDLALIGKDRPNLVCREWNIYVEFKFENDAGTPDVATPSDKLKTIDLYQNGVCL